MPRDYKDDVIEELSNSEGSLKAERSALLSDLGDAELRLRASGEGLEKRIAMELQALRVKRDARRLLEAEGRELQPIPRIETLRHRLALPREPLRYRIADWMTVGSNVMVVAQHKTGKTTARDNTIRSLLDGDDFLGRYQVTPISGTVLVLDFEMSESQATTWFRDQGIRNDDRVLLVTLRGAAGTFNILDEQVRAEWAERVRPHGVEVAVLDCIRPPMDALGLDEHKDGGRFLVAWSAFLKAAGISESFVIQHMGHNGERARGDSRFLDWPDASWRIVRQDEDPSSPRFMSAYGRDVDVPESQLEYDPATRRLTIAGGSRRDAGTRSALDAVLGLFSNSRERLSVRAIQAALEQSGHPRDQIRLAIKAGVTTGEITTTAGARGAILHHRAAPCGDRAPHSASECAAAYIEPHARTLAFPKSDQHAARTLEGGDDGDGII